MYILVQSPILVYNLRMEHPQHTLTSCTFKTTGGQLINMHCVTQHKVWTTIDLRLVCFWTVPRHSAQNHPRLLRKLDYDIWGYAFEQFRSYLAQPSPAVCGIIYSGTRSDLKQLDCGVPCWVRYDSSFILITMPTGIPGPTNTTCRWYVLFYAK